MLYCIVLPTLTSLEMLGTPHCPFTSQLYQERVTFKMFVHSFSPRVSVLFGISSTFRLLKRSITCLGNILSALRNRWQSKHNTHISTAEVSVFFTLSPSLKLHRLYEYHYFCTIIFYGNHETVYCICYVGLLV